MRTIGIGHGKNVGTAGLQCLWIGLGHAEHPNTFPHHLVVADICDVQTVASGTGGGRDVFPVAREDRQAYASLLCACCINRKQNGVVARIVMCPDEPLAPPPQARPPARRRPTPPVSRVHGPASIAPPLHLRRKTFALVNSQLLIPN